ncbi:hypothetical protein C3B55_00491 [Candidatus Pseudomonas adelgestsugas]|uniref:Uncharacterized protein n=1 Tax=Candidatus Pseudomonas adelgestsugas TaxID=1302376 RepID=A0ABX5R868_9PSED|nr:hypothetical protein C3B55_00491 [Candidatus Pseudomonas adelgestsugas]
MEHNNKMLTIGERVENIFFGAGANNCTQYH